MTSYRTMSCPFCSHRTFCVDQSLDDIDDLRLTCADCGMDHPSVTVMTARAANVLLRDEP